MPEEWRIPDLPLDRDYKRGGHRTPADFDPSRFKVLFTRVRTHAPEAAGRRIVATALGRDTIVLVRVDLSTGSVTAIESPPEHVHWGDIPTPMF